MTAKQKREFIDSFKLFQADMWENSASKGFHDADARCVTQEQKEARIGLSLMLIVSELAEAMEAMRMGNPPDSHIPKFSGMEAELADTVIRIADLARQHNLRLADAIMAKAAYNKTRKKMHGGKRF